MLQFVSEIVAHGQRHFVFDFRVLSSSVRVR